MDYVYKKFADFYGDFRDPSTGKVTDPTGRVYDLTMVSNTDMANRQYKGLVFQGSYRGIADWQLGGNYTLSWQRGNFTGEDEGSGPIRFAGNDQPEYKSGRLELPDRLQPGRPAAQAARVGAIPAAAARPARADWNLGLVERFDTSDASSADGTIDPRPYVTNPGYQSVPSTVTYYFGPRGDQRYDGVWRTDLSLFWSLPIAGARARGVLPRRREQPVQPLGADSRATRPS